MGIPEGALSATDLAGYSGGGWSAGAEQTPAKTGTSSDTRYVKEAAKPFFVGAALAALDRLLAEAKDFLDGMPTTLPPGALQAARSASGGSSGGFGFELLGGLALLSILLLGGKHLWASSEFIKPSSALLPIIERPG